jgi:ABC-type polysaccharide transport system permease subunit
VFGFADGSDAAGVSRVLDPATGALAAPAATPNAFCSGHAFLDDGRLLVTGGHHMSVTGVRTFDPAGQQWSPVGDMPHGRWYPTCTSLPDGQVLAISGTAAGVIWRLMYADDPHVGTVNAILQHIIPTFQPISFLGSSNFVNFALIGAYLWASLGFAVVVLSAALKAIPRDLTEAARSDGATELQIFRRVTVPLMWPTITVIGTLTMIGVLKIFDIVYTMTSEGPAGASAVLATRMYIEAFKNADTGYGSAIAVVLLIAVIPIMALNIRRFRAEGPK